MSSKSGQTSWCKARSKQVHSEFENDLRLLERLFTILGSMSSDGLYSSNANLALKGIMGLYAMGEINKILEARGADTSKTSYYSASDIIVLPLSF